MLSDKICPKTKNTNLKYSTNVGEKLYDSAKENRWQNNIIQRKTQTIIENSDMQSQNTVISKQLMNV